MWGRVYLSIQTGCFAALTTHTLQRELPNGEPFLLYSAAFLFSLLIGIITGAAMTSVRNS